MFSVKVQTIKILGFEDHIWYMWPSHFYSIFIEKNIYFSIFKKVKTHTNPEGYRPTVDLD